MPTINRVQLNDERIKAARVRPGAARRHYFDAGQPGLVLRVTAAGRKTFYVWHRDKATGRPVWAVVKDPALASHEYGVVTLENARELARRILNPGGENPIGAYVAATAAADAAAARTFGALAALYIERHAKAKKKSWREDDRIVRNVLNPFAERPVAALTRREIRALLDAIVDRGAPVAANRTLACLRKILNFGVDREWLDANPIARLAAPATEAPRQRVLTDAELAVVWRHLAAPPADADAERRRLWPLLAAWIKLRLVTAQRGEEVIDLQWAHLELAGKAVWTNPTTKNGRVQRVPLSPLAVSILKGLRAAAVGDPVYVFTGIRSKRDRHNIFAGAGIGDLQLRDLRRTAATNLAKLGIDRFVVARILNHTDGAITAVYDAYGYEPQKRAALDKWAARLRQITKPRALRLVARAS